MDPGVGATVHGAEITRLGVTDYGAEPPRPFPGSRRGGGRRHKLWRPGSRRGGGRRHRSWRRAWWLISPLSFFLPELLSFVPPLSRFLSQPPLAQTTNLTLRSPIKTTDLQEQGILYALLIFHAWILFSVGALLK